MRVLAVKSILFLVLFTGILSFIVDPVFKKPNNFEESIEEFYDQTDKPLDILFMGSSHARNTYNPLVIDKALNVSSFNLGTGGQRLAVTNYLLKDILKSTKPKLLILDVFPGSVGFPNLSHQKSNQLTVFDYTKWSFNKWSLVKEIYSFAELPSVISPTIRNHDKWYEANWMLEPFTFNTGKHALASKGFVGSYKTITGKPREKFINFNEETSQFFEIKNPKVRFSDYKEEFDEINNTLQICKENNVKLLLVSAPYFNSIRVNKTKEFHHLLRRFSDSLNIDFLDFNSKFDKLNLTIDDFRDAAHVNVSGSEKVSAYLTRYLSDENYFEIKNPEVINQYKVADEKGEEKIADSLSNDETKHNEFIIKRPLFDNALIEKVNFTKNETNYTFTLAINKGIEYNSVLSKYRLAFHGLVNDEDKPLLTGKFKNKDRQVFTINPRIIKQNNSNIIVLEVPITEIDRYKTIRFISYGNKHNKDLEKRNFKIDNLSLK